jgi:hypothetical protein
MNYAIRWTQPLHGWEPLEFEIKDFTEARAVLARIMAL